MTRPSLVLTLVAETSILTRRLGVVMRFAQWLPVGAIPEQTLISLVRHDVIDDGCRPGSATSCTLGTQRMLGEETCASLLPPCAITTLS